MNFTNITGETAEWQAIDDPFPTQNKNDFIYSQLGSASELEVLLSTPDVTPRSNGKGAVYYSRYRSDATGQLVTDGNDAFMTVTLLQGATVIASSPAVSQLFGDDIATVPFDLSLVTDWTNLRIRYNITSSGGSPTNRRGQGSYFAFVKIRTSYSCTFT